MENKLRGKKGSRGQVGAPVGVQGKMMAEVMSEPRYDPILLETEKQVHISSYFPPAFCLLKKGEID